MREQATSKKRYICFDGKQAVEIPPEALEDIEKLLTFLESEIMKEADRINGNIDIDNVDAFRLPEWDFALYHEAILKAIRSGFYRDKAGNVNRHIENNILTELKEGRPLYSIRGIERLLTESADGVESDKRFKKIEYYEAREWLALPNSKDLVRICEEMRKEWEPEGKPDRKSPPLYAIITLCMIQALYNYTIIEAHKIRIPEDLNETIAEIKQLKNKFYAELKHSETAEQKNSLTAAHGEELAKLYAALKIPAEAFDSIIFKAANIGEMLRGTLPACYKDGKEKNGKTPYIKRLEEVIINLESLYNIPIVRHESIKPQKGTTALYWQGKINGETRATIAEHEERRINILTFPPIGESVGKYVFIDNAWLKHKGLEDFLINEQRINAYYYIVLKITEAQQAGQDEVNINLEELLKLCGYDGASPQTRDRFIYDIIKKGIPELLKDLITCENTEEGIKIIVK